MTNSGAVRERMCAKACIGGVLPRRVPGSNHAKTYGRKLSPILQTLTGVISETFPKIVYGLLGAAQHKSFTYRWLRALTFPKRSVIGKVSPGQWALPHVFAWLLPGILLGLPYEALYS
jgi:hypothetical protein